MQRTPQDDERDKMIPNQASQKEKAEGSREPQDTPTRGASDTADEPVDPFREPPDSFVGERTASTGGGISNRSLDEEQDEQEDLPSRGDNRQHPTH